MAIVPAMAAVGAAAAPTIAAAAGPAITAETARLIPIVAEKAQALALRLLDKLDDEWIIVGIDEDLDICKVGEGLFDIRVTPGNAMALAGIIFVGWMTWRAWKERWVWDPFGLKHLFLRGVGQEVTRALINKVTNPGGTGTIRQLYKWNVDLHDWFRERMGIA